MGKRRWRKQKFIDKKQQLRFAMELALYAVLFPLFFLVLSLADPIARRLMGNDTEKIQPLYSLLSFCIEHWWEFFVALGLVGFLSVLFSLKIFGPMRSFEQTLLQKKLHPTEPVDSKLRSDDYFQDFSHLLAECLNGLKAFGGPGDSPGAPQPPSSEIYDGESEGKST